MINYEIQAEVHKQLPNGSYRVKVMILNSDIAMYINGNTVFAPGTKYDDWFVGTPKAGYARIVEFNGKSPLWSEYRAACIEVVQEFIRTESLDETSVSKKELEQFKIDLEDLKF